MHVSQLPLFALLIEFAEIHQVDQHEVLHCQSLHQMTGEHRSALHDSHSTIKTGHCTGQGLFQNKPTQHAAFGQ